MTREELEKKHALYTQNLAYWNFFRMAYDGGRDFIHDALVRHPMETYKNYQARLAEGICFNYSAAIIDLFNFYLTERAPARHLKGLEKDPQWMMFESDADLYGTDFDTYLNNTQKISSVYGSAGVLVNKASNTTKIVAQEIEKGIYPYCSTYTMTNIHDWEFERDPETNRPVLSYLKLKEAESGRWTIWRKDLWEVWEIPDYAENTEPLTGGSAASPGSGDKQKATIVGRDKNPLNEIPFVWMPNIKNIYTPYLGISDIREISYITASIIRNLSHGEEVIKFAGFPMLRVPMLPEDKSDGEVEVLSGQRAVQEFPPDNPQAKPDWMEAAIAEPIEAVLQWIDRKVDETYRVAHLSGVHGQRKSNNEVSSGLALRYEFQQLNSVLLQKSNNMLESEQNIIRLWLKWQNRENLYKEVEITRAAHFSIDDLSINLENVINTMASVQSNTFKAKAQKQLAKIALPDLSDSDFEQIEKEINASEIKDEGKNEDDPSPSSSPSPEAPDEG